MNRPLKNNPTTDQYRVPLSLSWLQALAVTLNTIFHGF